MGGKLGLGLPCPPRVKGCRPTGACTVYPAARSCLPAWTLARPRAPRSAKEEGMHPAHGGLRLVYRDERDNEPLRPPAPPSSEEPLVGYKRV